MAVLKTYQRLLRPHGVQTWLFPQEREREKSERANERRREVMARNRRRRGHARRQC
jgi:hypothetical protein